MKPNELIEILNKMTKEKDIEISIDISTCEDDYMTRVFVREYIGMQDSTTLLFTGESNEQTSRIK